MVARLWEAGPEAGPDGSTLASLKALTEEARLRAHAPTRPRRSAARPRPEVSSSGVPTRLALCGARRLHAARSLSLSVKHSV
jgi:hypothetical protein